MDIIAFLTPYPAWIKILLVVGVLCAVAAIAGMVFTPVTRANEKSDTGGGAVNITSHGQQGGITAHTVNSEKK